MEPTHEQPDQGGEPHGEATVLERPGMTRVRLTGDIDGTIQEELSEALERAARRNLPVEVDCSAVRFMDSTGLSTLAWLANFSAEPPLLLGVPESMGELLRLTGMDGAFAFGVHDPQP